MHKPVGHALACPNLIGVHRRSSAAQCSYRFPSVLSTLLPLTFSRCLCASVMNSQDNYWPQMNADKHRWSTRGVFGVHPSPSVANKCFPAFSSVPSAASVLSMLLPLTFSPCLRASVVKDKRQPLKPQRSPFLFLLPSASQR